MQRHEVLHDIPLHSTSLLRFVNGGGGWAADLSGLPDSLFEKHPTLAHRNDIRICLNDAKVVKHIQH